MKNTKKYLSTGIALAITLFTSVQVTAMRPARPTTEAPIRNLKDRRSVRVNPNLSYDQAERVRREIKNIEDTAGYVNCDPKNNLPLHHKRICDRLSLIPKLEKIRYGNRAYTDEEIEQIMELDKQ